MDIKKTPRTDARHASIVRQGLEWALTYGQRSAAAFLLVRKVPRPVVERIPISMDGRGRTLVVVRQSRRRWEDAYRQLRSACCGYCLWPYGSCSSSAPHGDTDSGLFRQRLRVLASHFPARQRHVRSHRRVAVLEGAPGVGGDVLVTQEHLDRRLCHEHGHLGPRMLARHTVAKAGDLDVIVDAALLRVRSLAPVVSAWLYLSSSATGGSRWSPSGRSWTPAARRQLGIADSAGGGLISDVDGLSIGCAVLAQWHIRTIFKTAKWNININVFVAPANDWNREKCTKFNGYATEIAASLKDASIEPNSCIPVIYALTNMNAHPLLAGFLHAARRAGWTETQLNEVLKLAPSSHNGQLHLVLGGLLSRTKPAVATLS